MFQVNQSRDQRVASVHVLVHVAKSMVDNFLFARPVYVITCVHTFQVTVMASTKYCLDGASQSDTSEPQSQDSAASFEDQIRFVTDSDCLKKKLFADGNDSEEDSISCTPPASLNDARGIANLDREECSSLFVDRSEMEWDNHFATPKVDKRRGMRRSLEQSDDDDAMFMTPPPKQYRIDETPCTPNGVASTSPLIHQGLQQLTLFDTPHTPKSLIRRASFQAMVQQTPLDAVKQVQWRETMGCFIHTVFLWTCLV